MHYTDIGLYIPYIVSYKLPSFGNIQQFLRFCLSGTLHSNATDVTDVTNVLYMCVISTKQCEYLYMVTGTWRYENCDCVPHAT